jgi:hypothetical protein
MQNGQMKLGKVLHTPNARVLEFVCLYGRTRSSMLLGQDVPIVVPISFNGIIERQMTMDNVGFSDFHNPIWERLKHCVVDIFDVKRRRIGQQCPDSQGHWSVD